MKKLSYQVLKETNYNGYLLQDAPERVLQFGEGNFLRGFVDCFVDEMNEKSGFNSKVVAVQPISQGLSTIINEQEGLYTLILRGREGAEAVQNKRVISSVSRCVDPYTNFQGLMDCAKNQDLRFIVSNTTEAGIQFDASCKMTDAPPSSFPAKLTVFLYERFKLGLKGFIILSCELIDDNGKVLKECVDKHIAQWDLGPEFAQWVNEENMFCSTLVDRIVTGYPHDEADSLCKDFGYEDKLIVTGETFAFWVIEGPQSIKEELPFEKAGLPIMVTDNQKLYKQRKVRILNGAHTALVMAAYLAGHDIVRNTMNDDIMSDYMNKAIYEEIIPTLDLPLSELEDFAKSVKDRFNNPYIDHSLLAICLNSTSKWKARVMPSLLEYVKRKGCLPRCLTFSLAAYIVFYNGGKERVENGLKGCRGIDTYTVQDEAWILDFFYTHKDDSFINLVQVILSNREIWGEDLSLVDGLAKAVIEDLESIKTNGMKKAIELCIKN